MKFGNVLLFSVLQSSLFGLKGVEGHGGMLFPPARNLLFTNYCPHCANGEGVCGDGRNSQWTTSTEPSVTYGPYFQLERTVLIANGVVEVSLWFTVGHLGVFTIDLCTNPPATLTEDCFVGLHRDPTDVSYSPYLEDSPDIFFLPENSCVVKATEAQPLTARFLVPEDAVTSHAVLRYRWSTGNSCSPSPYSTIGTMDPRISNFSFTFNGATCGLAKSALTSCGNDCPNASCSGEKFTNCADVAIHAGAAGTVVSKYSHTKTTEDVNAMLPTTSAPGGSTSTKATTTRASTTTSAPTSSVATTTAAPGVSTTTPSSADTCRPGGPVVGSVEECRSKLLSFGGFDDFCRDNCDAIAAGEMVANRWCQALSICDLPTCVATFWSNVCRKV